MLAGKLERRIKIQRRSATLTASGQPVDVWADIVSGRFASVGPLTGSERFSIPQITAKATTEFQIRYSPAVADVHAGDRIIYPVSATPPDNTIYDIISVTEIGRREGLKIVAERGPVPHAVFSAESLAIFAAMAPAPDDTRKAIIDAAVSGLVASGVWGSLDVLYVLAAHGQQPALLDWRHPSNDPAVTVASPAFVADRGFVGNGVDAYVDTGYNPAGDGVFYALNSASVAAWITLAAADGQAIMGTVDGRTNLFPGASGQYFVRVNDGASDPVGASPGLDGLFVGVRSGASSKAGYRNGVLAGTSTWGSGAVPNTNILGLQNGNDSFSSARLGLLAAGGGLTTQQQAAFYASALAYMQAVGAA